MKVNLSGLVLFSLLCFYTSSSLSQISNWPLKGININMDGTKIEGKDIDEISISGMDLVVLNLKPRRYSKVHKIPVKDAFDIILNDVEQVVKFAQSHEMNVILEISEFPIFEKRVKKRSPEFWHNPVYVNEIFAVTETLAKRFSSSSDNLIAYKILDEPTINEGGKLKAPNNWREIQKEIVSRVRKYDTNKFVVVTSGPGGHGSEYEHWEPLPDNKIIYGAHFFRPQYYTHQGIGKHENPQSYPSKRLNKHFFYSKLSPIINFQKKYDVPILIGSFSTILGSNGDLRYLNDLIDVFDEHQFSWAYWQYNGFPGWNVGKEVGKDGVYVDKGSSSRRWKLLHNKIHTAN